MLLREETLWAAIFLFLLNQQRRDGKGRAGKDRTEHKISYGGKLRLRLRLWVEVEVEVKGEEVEASKWMAVLTFKNFYHLDFWTYWINWIQLLFVLHYPSSYTLHPTP